MGSASGQGNALDQAHSATIAALDHRHPPLHYIIRNTDPNSLPTTALGQGGITLGEGQSTTRPRTVAEGGRDRGTEDS
jgi:hypothetical protein